MIDVKYTNQELAEILSELLLEFERDCIEFERFIQSLKDTIKKEQERELLLFINNLNSDFTPHKMRERLSISELRDFKKTINSYIKVLSQYDIGNKYIPIYKRYLDRVNITQLEATTVNMMYSLDEKILKLLDRIPIFFDDLDGKSIKRINYELQKVSEYKKVIVPKQATEDLSEIIKRNRDLYYVGLEQQIQQLAIRMLKREELQAELEKRINRSFNNISGYIRTELNNRFNNNLLESMKANKVDEFEYCAILDNRTSEMCRDMDGRKFKVSEGEQGVNIPPLHMRCRSFIVPVIETNKRQKELSFEEWEKKYFNWK